MSGKDWLRFWALGIIWGTSYFWIKIAVAEVSPSALVTIRVFFGALGLLLVILFSKSVHLRWREIRPTLGVFFILGMFNIAVPFVLITWSEQYIDSGLAAILTSTVPLFAIMIAPWFVPDDRFTYPKLAGLLVGFFGVVILVLPEITNGIAHQSLWGQLAVLAAALSYAGATVFARVKSGGQRPQIQAFLQLAAATLIMVIFTSIFERPIDLPQTFLSWFALLWLGLLGSCVAYLLYFALLPSIGPTKTTMVTYIPPLVGVILGTLFLGEQLSWQVVVGGALIVSGIAMVNLKWGARMQVKDVEGEPS